MLELIEISYAYNIIYTLLAQFNYTMRIHFQFWRKANDARNLHNYVINSLEKYTNASKIKIKIKITRSFEMQFAFCDI
jgi:hypothetical protein